MSHLAPEICAIIMSQLKIKYTCFKNHDQAQRLRPVILATLEAEIKRAAQEKVSKTPSLPINQVWLEQPEIPATWEV
jgi:hypothetical protein